MDRPRPLFIVNPAAGNGRAGRLMPRIVAALPEAPEVRYTSAPGHAEDLAHQGALEGFTPIMAVGGDGTVHEVLNGVMRAPEPPPLGIVPIGGGNDFARTLRLPKDPVEAARLAWCDAAGRVDVGVCNGRHFLNVGGVGLDTSVAIRVNSRRGWLSHGKLGYIVHALIELSRYRNPQLTLRLDDTVVTTPSLLVAVANGRYFAGGMKICPRADPADGMLDICVGGDLRRWETLMLMPAIFVGQHGRHRKVTFHRARSVRIDGPDGLAVQLDGELGRSGTLPAELSVLPGALRIVGWGAA